MKAACHYGRLGILLFLVLLMALLPMLHSHRGQAAMHGWHLHFVQETVVAPNVQHDNTVHTALIMQMQQEPDSPEIDVPPTKLSKLDLLPELLAFLVVAFFTLFTPLYSPLRSRLWMPRTAQPPLATLYSIWQRAAAAPPVLAPPLR